MRKFAIKAAASALAVGLLATGFAGEGGHVGTPAATANAPRAEAEAARLEQRARAAAERGDLMGAIDLAEQAVARAPRDTAYRMLLADLYLKQGRFRSAETAFLDLLVLDPDHVRAGLSVALAQIAQGRQFAARGALERMEGRAPAGDLGLAYALAGDTSRGLELLETAARAENANARVRQNLALVLALSGDWQRARTIAAQDVSPAELGGRMQYWATLARPDAPWTQVAGLLGVTPSADPGQPVHLALAPPPVVAPVSLAETELPVEAPVSPAPEAPVAVAELVATPAPRHIRVSAPAFVDEEESERAAAAETLVQPVPAVLRAAETRFETAPPVFQRPDRVPVPLQRAVARPGEGRFVVQIGAYSSAANAERAWAEAERRFGFGADATPLTTTIAHGGRTLHRVSVAGFAERTDAGRVCAAIRTQGGACFVREMAGDAPVRWASRANGRPPA